MIFDVALCSAQVVVAAVVMSAIADRYTRDEGNIIRFSFVMHVLFIIANMAVTKYVYGRGDMYAFHDDGMALAGFMRSEPSLFFEIARWMFGYESDFAYHAGSEGTRVMIGLSSFFNLMFFDSFAAFSFFPGLLGFFSKIAIFDVFRDTFGRAQRRWVAAAFLCTPSVVFWSAGMIKETIAFCALGLIAAGWNSALKRRPLGLLVLGLGIFLLQAVKAHFMLTGVLALAAFVYWKRSVRNGRVTIRPITLVLLGAATMGAMLAIGEIAPRFAVTNLAEEVVSLQSRSAGGSKIDIGVQQDMGVWELAQIAPIALFTGLFRPWLGEASSATALINSIETTILLFFTIRALARRKVAGMYQLIIQYPTMVFLLVFSLLSAFGVGLATGNLGTLSRYRAPIVPFFVLAVMMADSRRVAGLVSTVAPKKARPTGMRTGLARF